MVKEEDVIKTSHKVVRAWRRWHKDSNLFPSDGLIEALCDLDKLFPGKKVGEE